MSSRLRKGGFHIRIYTDAKRGIFHGVSSCGGVAGGGRNYILTLLADCCKCQLTSAIICSNMLTMTAKEELVDADTSNGMRT
ncbi:hypothetical protein [Gellertiella hungarica]|uniref:Uncharacterized protein n=1 Tax=Gellertiella hungarica TaxID=1572859 RepID=A0A7W6J967_9HYPH|nr:hypothetical protein [Gellertiella hungarica]MBB4067110.1 hypothetical protein [Gellertiella hungarica]